MSEKIKLTIYTTTACEYTKGQVRKKLELEKLEYQCELGLHMYPKLNWVKPRIFVMVAGAVKTNVWLIS